MLPVSSAWEQAAFVVFVAVAATLIIWKPLVFFGAVIVLGIAASAGIFAGWLDERNSR